MSSDRALQDETSPVEVGPDRHSKLNTGARKTGRGTQNGARKTGQVHFFGHAKRDGHAKRGHAKRDGSISLTPRLIARSFASCHASHAMLSPEVADDPAGVLAGQNRVRHIVVG